MEHERGVSRMVRIVGWIAILGLLGISVTAYAEDVTITSYYPSPRGVYEELRSTGETHLATSAGNVGIGMTAPDRKLRVTGSSAGVHTAAIEDTSGYGIALGAVPSQTLGSIQAYGPTTATMRDLALNAGGGNIGIGTTAPGGKVHVKYLGDGPALLLDRQPEASDRFVVRISNNGADDLLATYSEAGGMGNGIVLQGNGRVGIGTSSPTARLDVQPVSAGARLGRAEVGAWPANTAYAYFGNQNLDHAVAGNYAILQSTGGTTYVNAANGQTVRFRVNNADRMIMNGSGDVAIGTTSFSDLIGWPGSLNVNGQVRAARYYDDNASYYVDSNTTSRMATLDTNEVTVRRGGVPKPVCLSNGSGCPAQSCTCSCP